jgi:hypothetical protein
MVSNFQFQMPTQRSVNVSFYNLYICFVKQSNIISFAYINLEILDSDEMLLLSIKLNNLCII